MNPNMFMMNLNKSMLNGSASAPADIHAYVVYLSNCSVLLKLHHIVRPP